MIGARRSGHYVTALILSHATWCGRYSRFPQQKRPRGGVAGAGAGAGAPNRRDWITVCRPNEIHFLFYFISSPHGARARPARRAAQSGGFDPSAADALLCKRSRRVEVVIGNTPFGTDCVVFVRQNMNEE
ncbi:hypothetical protein EVAR_102183_1 [Eumeta japonica]|uniref:Uncharacterized protein n=1 Tax=Eumeta variegata TaxID=151549 RepID=A0A4C2AEX4_EUMVA|nr:hypothetical protein EVAR_102183_1 [Eumeta japonica]